MPLIRRIQPTSDETPPWAGMAFTQPVDSDDLNARLLKAYPHPLCTTLRERKHMAAIDFLKAELRQMQCKDQASVPPEYFAGYHALASPKSPTFSNEALERHSRTGSLSSLQSPASSARLSLPIEQSLQRGDTSNVSMLPTPTDSSTAPPGQNLVFSAKDGQMVHPKTKRKMTIEEKIAYKETRSRGACKKCKKMKGKVKSLFFVELAWKHDMVLTIV